MLPDDRILSNQTIRMNFLVTPIEENRVLFSSLAAVYQLGFIRLFLIYRITKSVEITCFKSFAPIVDRSIHVLLVELMFHFCRNRNIVIVCRYMYCSIMEKTYCQVKVLASTMVIS